MDNLESLTNENITPIDDLIFYRWCTIVLISKRNSGKTTLIKNLMFNICNNNNYNAVFIFSETAQYEKDEWSYVDDFYKTDEIQEKINKMIEYQQQQL